VVQLPVKGLNNLSEHNQVVHDTNMTSFLRCYSTISATTEFTNIHKDIERLHDMSNKFVKFVLTVL